MVEPMFKAPPPPPLPTENKTPEEVGQSQDVPTENNVEADEEQDTPMTPIESLRQNIEQYLWFVLGGCVVIGLLLGIMMGGDTVVAGPQGLMGVVGNPGITEPLPRCGRANDTDTCILYIMNHTRYDKEAKDFYKTVVELTGRQEYLLSIENQVYGIMKIPPGYFAEFKVPSLR